MDLWEQDWGLRARGFMGPGEEEHERILHEVTERTEGHNFTEGREVDEERKREKRGTDLATNQRNRWK